MAPFPFVLSPHYPPSLWGNDNIVFEKKIAFSTPHLLIIFGSKKKWNSCMFQFLFFGKTPQPPFPIWYCQIKASHPAVLTFVISFTPTHMSGVLVKIIQSSTKYKVSLSGCIFCQLKMKHVFEATWCPLGVFFVIEYPNVLNISEYPSWISLSAVSSGCGGSSVTIRLLPHQRSRLLLSAERKQGKTFLWNMFSVTSL